MLNSVHLERLDLNLLVVFDVVMQERHVGRSARRLHLTPSAVSHGLGRLRSALADPLFLKAPKGVVPTTRASELAAPIAEILSRIQGVLGTARPFDPAQSRRRFTIGAPDGVAAVFLPKFLAAVRKAAPGIDISVVNLLPMMVAAALDAKHVDVALAPAYDLPARLVAKTLYEEDFVVAGRANHAFLRKPTLGQFCKMQHVVLSLSGDPVGFMDTALARRGLSRRVALTVPSQMLALAIIAETDFIAALPHSLIAMHGPAYGVKGTAPPLAVPRDTISAIAPAVAFQDTGIAWLVSAMQAVGPQIGADKSRTRKGTRQR